MPVRVGVIGLGIMGSEHARLLGSVVSGAVLGGVYDVDRSRAETSGARVYDDPASLVYDRGIDAVLIASADPTHEQFVLDCLHAGKPVLCEKPLAPDVAGCRRILDAEERAGRSLVTVGFMRRYDPGYVEMRAALRSGEIGHALVVHCVHRNTTATARSAQDLVTGSAVHEIDTARWLLGEEIVAVTAHLPRASGNAGGVQDPLLLVLESESGVLVDVEVFVNAGYGYDVRCELVAEDGAVSLDQTVTTVRRSKAARTTALASDWRDRFAEAYRRELQDWVDGVADGAAVRGASARDGYAAALVADAVVRALDGGPQRVGTP